jgi:hypothetical protein
MEAASTSETSVNFYQTTGARTQKTAIFRIEVEIDFTGILTLLLP